MNKAAIITGTNRGIGKAIARKFAQSGYDLFACARKHNEEFEYFLQELSSENNIEVQPVYFDLNNEEEIKSGIKSILDTKRDIDVLINNAGIAHGGLLTMTSLPKLREVYQVNVFAQVQLMQMVARKMMRKKRGVIINMCSVGGIETSPGYLAYGSSKAALIWITKSLARELGGYGIRVNGIAPGLIDTDMGYYKSQEELQKVRERMSIDRIGTPDEVAEAALYVASDAAAYMTGQILVLDGGRV